MKSSLSFEKAWFAVSLLVLAFGYGFASHAWGWFPATYVGQAYDQAQAMYSKVQGIPPDSGPVVYNRSGTRVVRPNRMQPGPILMASSWKDLNWEPAVRILGRKGDVLHEWETSPEKIFPSVVGAFTGFRDFQPPHGFRLFENGDLLVNGQGMGLARLNACGEVIRRVSTPETHHSGARGENGTVWVPARSKERVSFSGLGGSRINHDIIAHISKDGDVIDKTSVLDLVYKSNLQKRIFKNDALHDPTHLNDIDILPDSISESYPNLEGGDILISLREIHTVMVLDKDTKKIKWEESDPFIRQHDPDFIGDGWIGVFDNRWDNTRRGSVLGGSRVVAVDTRSDSTQVLYPTSSSDTFYTATAGRWQRLGNGNLLLTESRAGRVFEVTGSGQLVWEWINQSEKSRVSEVYGARRVDMTREEIASWSCSSIDSVSTTAQNSSTQNQQTTP